MKIALAHARLDRRGGTELDFYRTAIGLQELGHEVHLFCGEFAIDSPAGTHVHSIPIVRFGRTARLWSFARLAPKIMSSSGCDVMVNFGRMIVPGVTRCGGGTHRVFLQKLADERGIGRRLWHALSPYHQSLLALERRQFQPGHYQGVLAVSRGVKRELCVVYGIPENKITVIYNGVDEKRFHPNLRDKSRALIRNQWHIPLDAPVVLFIGSGFRRKGLDRLLKAWSSSQIRDVYLIVVGDDARRATYQAWAEEQANGKIIFVGRRDDVESYYGAADLLALPAIQEAFGNVVLEALATGLPAVVSPIAGAAEILKGELAEGILAHPEDPQELATKLLAMLDRGRRGDFSRAARKLAESYSWSCHFNKLDRFLKDMVEQSSGPSST